MRKIFYLSLITIFGLVNCGGNSGGSSTPTPTPTPKPTANNIEVETVTSKVKKTGQDISYQNFDDGYYQIGVDPNYYTDSDIVFDKITGLVWERFSTENYRITWHEAQEYCKKLSLRGYYEGWRLPTISELRSIVNRGEEEPALDSDFIDMTSRNYNQLNASYFWSSTYLASEVANVWGIDFVDGSEYWRRKNDQYAVKCVHDKDNSMSLASDKVFSRKSIGIVSDNITKLAWQDSYKDNNGEIKLASFQDALTYCNELRLGDYNDWRVPNINELLSIVDNLKSRPSIGNDFLYVGSDTYFSSTTLIANSNKIWGVDFIDGGVSLRNQSHKSLVRCVRVDNQ